MLDKLEETRHIRPARKLLMISWLILFCIVSTAHGQSDNELKAAEMMNVDSINTTAGTIVLNGEAYRLALKRDEAVSSNYRWSSDNTAVLRQLRAGDTVMVSFGSDGAKVVRLQKIESIAPPDKPR